MPVLEAGAAADEATLVDVAALPKRQVIRLDFPERDLVGRVGTTAYDFFNTRFRVGR